MYHYQTKHSHVEKQHLFHFQKVTTQPTMASFNHTLPNSATTVTQTTYKMARNIDSWQHEMITHMVYNKNRLANGRGSAV
jgi:hypothetical protein